MSPQVDAILQQINRLDEDDRLILERRLQEQTEAEWQQEARKAREIARRQGIDQQAIDTAIESQRYGS